MAVIVVVILAGSSRFGRMRRMLNLLAARADSQYPLCSPRSTQSDA
jgi:hypothetical protein